MKKILSIALVLILAFSFGVSALNGNDAVTSVAVDTVTADGLTFSGRVGSEVLAVAAEVFDGTSSVALQSFAVENGTYAGSVKDLALTEGKAYTLRVANYSGGTWESVTFTAPYVVPVTNGSNTVEAYGNITGNTAAITVKEADLNALLNNAATTGQITINGRLSKGIESLTLDKQVIAAISAAAQDENKAITGLTVVTDSGTVAFDQTALAALASKAEGTTVTITVEEVSVDSLTQAQKEALGTEHAKDLIVSVTVTAGGKTLSDYNGGKITVTLPYTLKDGADPADLHLWYLATDGNMTEVECVYDAVGKTITFTVNHLSDFVVSLTKDTPWQNPFVDVAEKDWFYDAVKYCHQEGLMLGTDTTHFAPYEKLTRGMAMTVLYRSVGQPAVNGSNIFSDLDNSQYYYNAVVWGIENKIIKGYPDGTFKPDALVTREEYCAMYHRYYAKILVSAVKSMSDFSDSGKVSDWAKDDVLWALSMEIIRGYPDGTLRPQGLMIRAEAATIFYNHRLQ